MEDSIRKTPRPYIGLSVRQFFGRGARCEFFPQPGGSEYILWVDWETGKRSTRIQDTDVAPIVAVLRNVQLPLIERFLGFDHTKYTLTFGHIDRVQVSWECNLPREWSSLLPALVQINKLSGIGGGLDDE